MASGNQFCFLRLVIIILVYLAANSVTLENDVLHCYSTKQNTFGLTNATRYGLPCASWHLTPFANSVIPNRHNYCINPDKGPGGPWCFVVESVFLQTKVRWDLCFNYTIAKEKIKESSSIKRFRELLRVAVVRNAELSRTEILRKSQEHTARVKRQITVTTVATPVVEETGCFNLCDRASTCVRREASCMDRPGNVFETCEPKVEVCRRGIDPGNPCRAGAGPELRYRYDTKRRTCRLFAHWGCDGNGNSFATYNECMGKCNGYMCYQLIDSGSAICFLGETNTAGIRYGYDLLQQRCRNFNYFGCAGNNNRFSTEASCKNVCTPHLL